jgi:hypothetical protein
MLRAKRTIPRGSWARSIIASSAVNSNAEIPKITGFNPASRETRYCEARSDEAIQHHT